jgi:cardiolipin synthase
MFYAIFATVLLTLHALGVWGAVDVIMKGRTAQGTTAWALALLFAPWAALPFYLVFGERRFEGYVRARRDGLRQIDQAAAALATELHPHARPPLAGDHDFTALTRLARLPFTAGNHVDLLIDGQATYAAIFTAIQNATQYVLVQFYIFRDDHAGKALAEHLIAARARGVRVMFLYDEIGSYFLPRAYLEKLTAAGVECSGFRTKPKKQKPFRINFRNHRKIVVVDGKTAFVGGLNIGDEYLGRNPSIGHWRDTHIAVTGPAALCLQLSFLEDWYWANRRIPTHHRTPLPPANSASGVLIVPSGPADPLETCSLMHTHIVNGARRRLWLATPYFVPDEELLGAIQLAAIRGVDVRLIIPAKNDSRLIQHSINSFLEELFQAGIKVYQYTDGFMHQKVILSDDVTLVGTANLDNRSFHINFEVTAIIADPAFATRAEQMLLADMERSRLMSPDMLRRMSPGSRFLSRFCRLFAPIQ